MKRSSGAYDLSGVTINKLLSDSVYSSPIVFLHAILSFQYVYGNLYTELEEYFKPPFDELIDAYINADYQDFSLYYRLPSNLTEFIQDSVWNNIRSDSIACSHPFRKALLLNNTYNWVLETPVRIIYCEADEAVPYENSVKAYNYMTLNGARNIELKCISEMKKHDECMSTAIQDAFDRLNELQTKIPNE